MTEVGSALEESPSRALDSAALAPSERFVGLDSGVARLDLDKGKCPTSARNNINFTLG